MNLVSLPIDEVLYENVLSFCEQKAKEGIDLDYKSEFPSDLARLLSAFANTQGGIALIGIEERGKSREPVCPPIGIDGPADVVRQRILNVAFDAVYPPLEPEVAVIQLPDAKRFVALIRVGASRLLHSVDRRTRIYIRSLDSNRGYELASLPDLRWLWDRRESSIHLRDRLQQSASQRSNSVAVRFSDEGVRTEWTSSPHLIVSCIPAYPKGPIVSSIRGLLDVANSLDQVGSPRKSVDRKVPWQPHKWRTIPSAVCLTERGPAGFAQYVELGVFAHTYFDFVISRRSVNTLPVPKNTDEYCIFAYVILAYVDVALRYSSAFYDAISFRWPVLLSVRLKGVSNMLLQYEIPGSSNPLAQEFLSPPSTDDTIDLLEKETAGSSIGANVEPYQSACAESLLWAFGVGWEESEIEMWLA